MAEDEYEESEYRNSFTSVEERLDEQDSKLEELDSKVDELTGGGDTTGAVIYCIGGMLAMILEWNSSHAIGWTFVSGVFSWAYVIYYVVVHWSEVKLF
jgi:hypothetical protein